MNGSMASSGERHCVFACAGQWFAVAASDVREVASRPQLTALPGAPSLLAGVCHQRSEFVPVLRLPGLSVSENADAHETRQMLVLSGPEGPWALLVDHVKAVPLLCDSPVRSGADQPWSLAIIGSASWSDRVVSLVDTNQLYRQAELALHQAWANSGTFS